MCETQGADAQKYRNQNIDEVIRDMMSHSNKQKLNARASRLWKGLEEATAQDVLIKLRKLKQSAETADTLQSQNLADKIATRISILISHKPDGEILPAHEKTTQKETGKEDLRPTFEDRIKNLPENLPSAEQIATAKAKLEIT